MHVHEELRQLAEQILCRFEKQRLERLHEGIREINNPSFTLDCLVTAIDRYGRIVDIDLARQARFKLKPCKR